MSGTGYVSPRARVCVERAGGRGGGAQEREEAYSRRNKIGVCV